MALYQCRRGWNGVGRSAGVSVGNCNRGMGCDPPETKWMYRNDCHSAVAHSMPI